MKLTHLAAFEKHLSSSQGLSLLPVYLIIGKDRMESLAAARVALAKANREVTWLQGDKISLDTFEEQVDSLSMFSTQRLLAIDEADALKQGVKDRLLDFLERPGEPMLLLLADGFLPQSKLYKKIEAVGGVLNLDDGKPWEKEERRAHWLIERAKQEGKHLNLSTAKAFVKRVGNEYSPLQTEFEKLLCYVGKESVLGTEAIEAICLKTEQETVWKLGDAILARDYPFAQRALQTLFHSGSPGIAILRALRKQVSNQLSGQYPPKRDIHSLQQALVAIDDAELQTKNSGASEELILDLLLAKLVK